MWGSAGLNKKDEGHQIFADELTQFAQQSADQRVQAIAERTAAPLRVSVSGRRGVGCTTVARAISLAGHHWGLAVSGRGCAADLQLYVIAEVVKPEDRSASRASSNALAVLNKADLSGLSGDGPIAAAQGHCAQFAPLLGSPVLPMSALLAVAALEHLDTQSWAALRLLADHSDPVPTPRRLLETLDQFGVALAVAALRKGYGPIQVRALLRRISGVDAVIERIVAAGARIRYRRMLDAVTDLEALAVCDPAIAEFLACDDTVIARMATATDAAGGLASGPDAPLPRAVHWRRRGHTAADELHRACAADIVRGSLRLWSRTGSPLREGEVSP